MAQKIHITRARAVARDLADRYPTRPAASDPEAPQLPRTEFAPAA